MTRPSRLATALAVAALLLAAPAATAAVDPKTLPATTELDLPASNGMTAQLEVFNHEFTLEIRRKDSYAVYRVDGEGTEAGLKARFGQLGTIDLAFQPEETDLSRPPKGCVGPPSKYGRGVFVGTVSFTGEGGYVRIEATRIEGSLAVWRSSEWRCPRHARQFRRHSSSPLLPISLRPGARGADPATLGAAKRRCGCAFVAYSFPAESGGPGSLFIGSELDRNEGMEIGRVASATAGASAFRFSHKDGTASVRPPAPFAGSGHFERRPHGPDLWRSTLRIPLLGAEPLDMRDGGYRATLVKDLPEFR